MEDSTYSGWKNYETWTVALWLDNDEPTYQLMRELARSVWREAPASKWVKEWGWELKEAAVCDLATRIRELVEEQNQIAHPSLPADLLNAAFSEVSWPEIAMQYIAEAVEETERKQGGTK